MDETQKKNQEANNNQKEQKPEVTIDDIQRMANENEEISKWLASEKDRHFSKSIETWKQNNLSEIVESEIKKRYPEETEEQRQLRELKSELEQIKQAKQIESVRNQAYKQATEKGLPLGLLDFFVASNAEKTAQNLEQLEKVWNMALQNQVAQTFKRNGREPHKSNTSPADDLQAQYQKAVDTGNMALAISLKSQMYNNNKE